MRYLPFTVLPLLLVAMGCTDQQDLVGIPDAPELSVQAAGAPTTFPIFDQFDVPNPCTGLIHTVTVTGTGKTWVHPNNDGLIVQSTVTTSDGFEGRETQNWTGAHQSGMFKVVSNTMLAHPSGARIRVHSVLLIDFQPPPLTVRVDEFTATCVRP